MDALLLILGLIVLAFIFRVIIYAVIKSDDDETE